MDAKIFGKFVYSQLFTTPTIPPNTSFKGQTIIVTGSNTGLGLEAARHYARLGANRLIIAVRSIEKGEAAKASIEASIPGLSPSVISVWALDLSSYESVKAFAERAKNELDRLDILLCNAGIATETFRVAEGAESTITVNVYSTILVSLLLLPKLKATAQQHNKPTNLTITSSEVHTFTHFNERHAASQPGTLLATLNDPKKADMSDRYMVSKLLEVFYVRALDAHVGPSYPVIINCVNPGLCHSELGRESGWTLTIMKFLLGRKTDVGAKTLVDASVKGEESRGQYCSNCLVEPPAVLVLSDEGKVLQQRVWEEVNDVVEGVVPGLLKGL